MVVGCVFRQPAFGTRARRCSEQHNAERPFSIVSPLPRLRSGSKQMGAAPLKEKNRAVIARCQLPFWSQREIICIPAVGGRTREFPYSALRAKHMAGARAQMLKFKILNGTAWQDLECTRKQVLRRDEGRGARRGAVARVFGTHMPPEVRARAKVSAAQSALEGPLAGVLASRLELARARESRAALGAHVLLRRLVSFR